MSKEEYFPRENYTKSFWLKDEDSDEFSRHRTTAELPKEVDVLVIGSGYSGTSTAYYLLEQDPKLKVAVFEARNVCSGATGRNGGHIKPYCHRNYLKYEKMLGEKGAAEVVNSEYEHLWAIKKIIEDLKIDCDFFLTRACDVYPTKKDARIDGDLQAAEKMLASPYVSAELKKQFQIIYGEDARIISKNPATEIAFSYPAASAWPWKLFTSILKKLVAEKGLNLQTNTLVTKTEIIPETGYTKVFTKDRGSTIAKKVVFATNGYTKGLLKEFGNVIVPQKGVACSITPVEKTGIPHLTNTYGFFTSRPNSDYLINRPDGTIIVGGRDEEMFMPFGNLDRFLDTTDDTYVESTSDAYFRNDYMKSRFSTWQDTKTNVSYIWSGILGYTNDSLPYVGELDLIGKPNCYIIAGFHGHGMPRILFSGKAVAECITQNKKIADVSPDTIPTGYKISKKRMEAENEYKQSLLELVKSKL